MPGSLNPRRCKATCGYPNKNRSIQMRRECAPVRAPSRCIFYSLADGPIEPGLLPSIVTNSARFGPHCTRREQPGLVSCVMGYNFLRLSSQTNFVNDPSEGSPTDTLLRLLLPLSSRTCVSSQHTKSRPEAAYGTNPKRSFSMTIGSSDGRCVQRAGT